MPKHKLSYKLAVVQILASMPQLVGLWIRHWEKQSPEELLQLSRRCPNLTTIVDTDAPEPPDLEWDLGKCQPSNLFMTFCNISGLLRGNAETAVLQVLLSLRLIMLNWHVLSCHVGLHLGKFCQLSL